MKVLFVCTGNICRSPTAEAVFRRRAGEAGLDAVTASAGIEAWHVGAPPDNRSCRTAAARGYDMEGFSGRHGATKDFTTFDLIVALDRSHRTALLRRAPDGMEDRVRLLLDFAPGSGARDVPDPYYGGPAEFEHALDLIEAGVGGLIDAIRKGDA